MPESRPRKLLAAVALRLLALAAYPMVIALALYLEDPRYRAFSLPLLAVVVLGPWPAAWPARLLLLAALLLSGLVVIYPAAALWPPGLICLAVAGWFASSLLPGRVPRIAQFAEAMHHPRGEQLPAGSGPWLRAWTALWALLLLVLALGALLLAITNQAQAWLIWVLLVIPVATLLGLLLEFVMRRYRFPDYPHLSASEFVLALIRIRPEQLGR